MKITVVGAGAWGTALAVALAARHGVSLWARDADQARAMASTRLNPHYLPDVTLPAAVHPVSDMTAALDGAGLVLIVTPTAGLRESLVRLRDHKVHLPLLWACKGFERGSAKFPHQIVSEEWGGRSASGALSGPSFAAEVARGKPTALVLASKDEGFARDTALELHQPALRIYYSDDVAGVEIGGAVKNVMAIATGVCDGLGLGLNARAALITRGLAEIGRLAARLGGRSETVMGLAGAGDLILTCTGDLSRNRRVGLLLATGRSLEDILADLGHVAEGVHSAQEVQRLAASLHVDMPIVDAVCGVLFRGVHPSKAVEQLLARDPKAEQEAP